MIKAVIFDMDGLLIDSEPLWHEAEKAVFSRAGRVLSTEQCLQTTGLRVDEVVAHWGEDPALAPQIVDAVIALIAEKGVAKPGVTEAIGACAGLPIALASSSAMRIIEAVLTRLGLTFAIVHSAEHEPYGKPHPAVYMTTAHKLGVSASTCVAIEDSPNGVRAAKAAGMVCIAVPDTPLRGDARFCEADFVVDSLLDVPRVLASLK